ncbi:MAG: asparagine synthetase B, partial [Saprospiraceae bacterium]|nr:asparagine synthetase B [Saprospiraceae bacterium]
MKYLFLFVLSLLFSFQLSASYIFLPMEHDKQKDHLKAYGITYWVVNSGVEAYWLLNYRGGSFAFPYTKLFEKECKVRGVTFEVISDSEWVSMREKISNPEINQEVIKLEKAPKIAVYTPDFNPMGKRIQPWDDAVTLVLTYAEIPFDKIYDREVIGEKLVEYDWLHLHHEDFTGQYGKFYSNQGGQAWYKMNQQKSEDIATALGFSKVSHLKLAVAKKIKEFVSGGGFMFAMCSATDTYDIALAAEGIDICSDVYDGDGYDINANSKLDYSKTFAFKDFQLILNPMVYEHSDID